MLLQFSVGNYRSFHDVVTMSMEAASIKSENKSVDENNLIPISKKVNLLTSAAIYGANASGKSNLIKAMAFMRNLVLNSARESQADDPIMVESYRLSTQTIQKPTFFEIIFFLDGRRYRYGFEATPQKIVREWLYCTFTAREARLFMRAEEQITPNSRYFREGDQLQGFTRPNALFLSVCAQFNGKIAQQLVKWFRNNLRFISGLDDTGYRIFTMKKYQHDASTREQILNLVRSFDVGIEDISIETVAPDQIPFPAGISDKIKELILQTPGKFTKTEAYHTQYDENGQPTGRAALDLLNDESEGTQKLFFLAGPLLDVLNAGRILIVDEMEARMHPLITCALIRLFNSRETNPNRAQLIFTTHDTNLLDRTLFRRDQIWFIEKDSYGASHLYSLVEFKARNDESFERNYLRGKYGAIPYLGDIEQIIWSESELPAENSDHGA